MTIDSKKTRDRAKAPLSIVFVFGNNVSFQENGPQMFCTGKPMQSARSAYEIPEQNEDFQTLKLSGMGLVGTDDVLDRVITGIKNL